MARPFWERMGSRAYHGAGNFVDDITGENQAIAAREGSRAQGRAADRANVEQRTQYDQARQNQLPYQQGGANAFNTLSRMTSEGGFEEKPFKFNEQYQDAGYKAPDAFQYQDFNFQKDPGYAFRMKQGIDAIQNSAAARGSLHGGNTLYGNGGIMDYSQGFASNEYDKAFGRYQDNRNQAYNQYGDARDFGRRNYETDRTQGYNQYLDRYGMAQDTYGRGVDENAARYNRLSDLAGYGERATNNLAGIGQNYANAYGNNLLGAANAQAAAGMYGANARAQGTQGLMNLGARGAAAYFTGGGSELARGAA